ncbi:uncharacterized protein PG998_015063 [Apiospora kogelbergensis]|uniref:uncharacterized protein n=1 Tax=Apiospora kogelbergensis TaxID=1337665 RepID=UPI0031317AAA
MASSQTSSSLEVSKHEPVPVVYRIPLDHEQQKRKRPLMGMWQRAQRFWNQGWGAEAYGAALAVCSLAVIIAVVASSEGKTLPEWPMHLTINALIAVPTQFYPYRHLDTDMGVATLGISQLKWQWFQKSPRLLMELDDFDNASRGPLGSISFLFKIRQWEVVNNFAKFAAILTILAAVVDPFSQQIVGVVGCTRGDDQSRALVGRTNGYYANGGHTGALSSEIDSPMAVAINVGLVGPPNHIPSLVSMTCASGNCTFGQNILPLQIAFSVMLNTSASISPQHLLDVRVMSRAGSLYSARKTPNAFQCQLFPCVRTYEASISRSVLQETILSEMPMGFDAFGGFGRYVLAATNLTRNSNKTANCSPRPANDTAGLALVADPNVDAAPQEPRGTGSKSPGAWYPEECVWTFGQSPYLAIRPELQSYLNRASVQTYTGSPTDSTIGSIVAKNLWRNATISFDTVDTFMRNLSDVMTATVRNNGQKSDTEYATGAVIRETTCVAVRWAWLSFPAVLVALGLAFLLILVVQSPKDSPAVRSWKSSNIAILFCSLEESIRQKTDLAWLREEIDDVARTSRAQLVQDGAGKAKFIKGD